MTESDKQDLRDVCEALSTAMVTVCRSFETQWGHDEFKRGQLMAALREKGQSTGSSKGKAVLAYIANRLEDKNSSLSI